jgi:hypothetical protein
MKTAFLSLITLALSSLASAVPASGSTAQSSSSSKHTVSPSGKASPASPTPSSAAAKSNPTPAGSAIPCKNVGDHGDGLYSGIKHDNGTSMYQFHGKGKPVAAASAAPASSKATKAAPTIDRRLNPDEKVNCLTGGNVPLADLDAARSGLVAQLGNGEYKIAKNNNLFVSSRPLARRLT